MINKEERKLFGIVEKELIKNQTLEKLAENIDYSKYNKKECLLIGKMATVIMMLNGNKNDNS